MNTRSIFVGAGAAAVIILAALGLKAAEHAHLIPAATSAQTFQVLMGLGLAFYGNFIPKRLGALPNPAAASRKQAVLRVAGWSFTLAGLAYAGLSAAMPTPLGDTLAIAAVGAAVAVTIVYSLACVMGGSRTPSGSAG